MISLLKPLNWSVLSSFHLSFTILIQFDFSVLFWKKKRAQIWGGQGDILSCGFICFFCYGLLKKSNLKKCNFTYTWSPFGLRPLQQFMLIVFKLKKLFSFKTSTLVFGRQLFQHNFTSLWICLHSSFPTVWAPKDWNECESL